VSDQGDSRPPPGRGARSSGSRVVLVSGAVGAFVLVLAVVTAARSGPVRDSGTADRVPPAAPLETLQGAPPVSTAATATPPPPPPPIAIPGWLSTALAVLGGALVLLLVVLAVRRLLPLLRALLARLRRQLPGGPREPGTGEGAPDDAVGTELRDRVSAAADTLAESTGPPRDAVVACWLDLESAAAATGSPRTAAQTPTEFTVGLLARYAAPDQDLSTLLRLYQRARFSDRPVTPQDVEVARRCLRRVAAAVPVAADPVAAGPVAADPVAAGPVVAGPPAGRRDA